METKFIFFSGKGGVGKTSMACTTGVYYADQGKRTLIVTTDPAANLSDVFEQEIGHRVTEIDGLENLFAMEIDPEKATNEYKERSLAPMRELFDEEMIKIAEEQLSGPCTEEMASFDKFIDFMEEDTFDIIIFDTAPTGHTIRLLELPVDWSKHIEESAKGSGQTCMGPVALIQESKQKYDHAIEKLRDTDKTDFIFVMQPEQTSLQETIRSSNELKELGINTTKIIINGFIPKEEAINHFFKSRYDMQQSYLAKAKETFIDIPIVTMELFDSELKGIEMFRKSSQKLFKGNNDKKSIENLIYPQNGKRKNIFFSGKGGVGKTSMACVTAIQTAKNGYKTLLMTTDPAAHIGNVLEKPVTDEITEIDGVDNLYAVKIDQKKATEEYKNMILSDAREKFDKTTVMTMEEELDSPCTEEMAAFQKFIEYANLEDFEVIVFDTAPTGHTLRLLELPMDWSKQIQFKAGESADISEADKKQRVKFQRVIEMLKDEERTTFAFVMYPEKTPIIEAFRASKELETVGIKTQLAVANLIIPKEQAITPFFRNRRRMQIKYFDEIVERFNEAKILQVPMYDNEIKGIDMLKRIGENCF
ncbi:TRC40/GET3/ArsA family transport-energizing ATPase [Paramaledivibacter caminithermalis]|uniref:Arsenite-transporting ATPase n=1 Tax=Paramaledivibacter caminithermalis (strain DSM 15212 / CIP 107654 / DViRD3) TaxID=1121301 RepID=A0A1M6LXM6_PARC5|nr:TRC40/GET3/ArsA family transport-energizing ATPase [Paramaledivibacter caminithermalis]SHJ75997.1 arsenite-transporting ATPase [Paramaledivibacter caminithermalis DSM 15212]